MQVVKSSVQANLNIANQPPRRANAASANALAGRTTVLVNNLRLSNPINSVNMKSVQVRKAETVWLVAGYAADAQRSQSKPSARDGKFNGSAFKPADVHAEYFVCNKVAKVTAYEPVRRCGRKKTQDSFVPRSAQKQNRLHAYQRSEI